MFFRRRPPQYRGHIDSVGDGRVSGWVWNGADPKRRLDVEILAAGIPLGVARADEFRADLAAGGVGDGRHAFTFALPDRGVPRETLVAKAVGADFYLFDSLKPFDGGSQNSTARGLPLLRPALSQRAVDESDIAIATELQQFWRASEGERAAAALENRREMWGDIVASRHRALRAALNGSDPRRLAEVLVGLQMRAAAEGLMQGERAYRDFLAASPEGRRAAVAPFHDMLASLAQYVGARRAECPEQNFEGEAAACDQETLADEIEAALADRIASPGRLAPPPVFDGLYGLAVHGRVLHGRDIQAIYAALRAIEAAGEAAPSICEIGGGFGKVAHYASMLGVERYVIVDLPTVSAMQYFYLRKTLPQTRIGFGAGAAALAGIDLILASDLPDRLDADIVLNVDSFPEMGDAVCSDYFARIPAWAPLLLSINQEAWREVRGPDHRQTVVGALLPQSGYKRAYRFRCWVRRGYVEELWRAPKRSEP